MILLTVGTIFNKIHKKIGCKTVKGSLYIVTAEIGGKYAFDIFNDGRFGGKQRKDRLHIR